MTSRLNTLQAGRALAALAVVALHVNTCLAQPKYFGFPMLPIFRGGDCGGVQYFFVLSGFVMFLAHHADFAQPGATSSFLWKRVRRLYPPLWIALAFTIGISLLLPSLWAHEGLSPLGLLTALGALPSEHEYFLAVEWTLRHEVLFYSLFAFALWKPKLGIPTLALWLAASLAGPFFPLSFPWQFFCSHYNVLFLMGVLSAYLYRSPATSYARTAAAAGAGVFLVAWTFIALGLTERTVWIDWSYGLGAALTIYGFAKWEATAGLSVPQWLVFLGEASYSLYLAHFPTVSGAAKVVSWLKLPALVAILATASAAVAAGILFHLWFEKPLLRRIPAQWQPNRAARS